MNDWLQSRGDRIRKRSSATRALMTGGSLAAYLILSAPSRSVAQDAGRFRIGTTVGASFFLSDVDVPLTGGGMGKISLDPAPLVGIETGYRISEDWEIGALFLFTSPGLSFSPPRNVDTDIDVLFLGGEIFYYLNRRGRPRPFLTAGAGGITTGTEFNDVDLAVDFGAGLAVPISRILSFRFDARDYISSGRLGGGTQHELVTKLGVFLHF